jgi:hypothetical protein
MGDDLLGDEGFDWEYWITVLVIAAIASFSTAVGAKFGVIEGLKNAPIDLSINCQAQGTK